MADNCLIYCRYVITAITVCHIPIHVSFNKMWFINPAFSTLKKSEFEALG